MVFNAQICNNKNNVDNYDIINDTNIIINDKKIKSNWINNLYSKCH